MAQALGLALRARELAPELRVPAVPREMRCDAGKVDFGRRHRFASGNRVAVAEIFDI